MRSGLFWFGHWTGCGTKDWAMYSSLRAAYGNYNTLIHAAYALHHWTTYSMYLLVDTLSSLHCNYLLIHIQVILVHVAYRYQLIVPNLSSVMMIDVRTSICNHMKSQLQVISSPTDNHCQCRFIDHYLDQLCIDITQHID